MGKRKREKKKHFSIFVQNADASLHLPFQACVYICLHEKTRITR